MKRTQNEDLDRHITGNWGEDQLKPPTDPNGPPPGHKARFMGLLEQLRAKALRKIGISATGQIFQIDVEKQDFQLYMACKRTVLLTDLPYKFGIGDCVRLFEKGSTKNGGRGREAHYFIKDILPQKSRGLKANFCVLTLE